MSEFSMDQYGSRFIQTKLENAGIESIRAVYDEIIPICALMLMQDVFGNYVRLRLFLGTFTDYFLRLSRN